MQSVLLPQSAFFLILEHRVLSQKKKFGWQEAEQWICLCYGWSYSSKSVFGFCFSVTGVSYLKTILKKKVITITTSQQIIPCLFMALAPQVSAAPDEQQKTN